MWLFEGVWVICAKPPLLHCLDVLIKMPANSLAVLNQQTLGRTNHAHFSQTLLTESCLVVWLWIVRRPICCFFLDKKVWIHRLGTRLMVSGIDLKFTLKYSEIFLFFVVGAQRGTC